MGCCAGCMRWTLVFLNTLVFISGVVALGFGIYVLVEKANVVDLLGHTADMPAFIDKAAIVLIVGGVLVAIVAGLGLCGAWKLNRRLLCTYGVVLTLALVVQLVALILAVVYRDEIETKLQSALKKSLSETYLMNSKPDDKRNGFSEIWDTFQYELECCGVESHIDYKDATYWITTDNLTSNATYWPIPLSCCKYSNPWEYPNNFASLEFMYGSCFPSWNSSNTWTDMGCYNELKRLLQKASLMILAVAALTGVIQLLLLLFAWALFCECCGTKEVLV